MRAIRPAELKQRLQQGEAPLIVDVREPWEYQICHIDGSEHIPMQAIPARYPELDRSREIVVVCHHGNRSAQVVQFLERVGFDNAINLTGGVDLWAQEVDPDMPRYD